MNFDGLRKLRSERARDAVGAMELGAPAHSLLRDDLSTVAFLSACVDAKLWVDAVRVMAMALPRREAAWWACLNARAAHDARSTPDEKAAAALQAAESWVFKPSEEQGQKAFSLAELAGFDCAESYAALAVFWSGGNMAPPESGVVLPPGEELVGTAAAAAVLLAAAAGDPQQIGAWYERAMLSALDIARGGSGRI